MKYKVLRQAFWNDRMFQLEREDGRIFYVDIFTNGGLQIPEEYLNEKDPDIANLIFTHWLKSFVGKVLEIEDIYPLYYSTTGKVSICKT